MKFLSRTLVFLSLAMFLLSCRAKPARVSAPALSGPDTVAQAREFVAQGDAYFRAAHLYAWRQAESLYRKAYEIHKDEAVKDKLILTRFLIDTREADEDIADAAGADVMASLCTEPLTPRQTYLCTLAPRYVAGPGNRALERPGQLDKAAFDLDRSDLDAYLYALGLKAYGINESTEETNARWARFVNSPLFTYLDFAKQVAKRAAELEKSCPQFAELYDQIGAMNFQKTKYNAARSYYLKTLDLIPDHTRSINGLGNIYLFALEDYDRALQYYEAALKWDPGNTAALYGKGTVLHSLGSYEASNAALDQMLKSDISRRGRQDATSIRYYQGQGYFYKAYNYHLMGNAVAARELVDTAKRYIPGSDSVNYLSGLLYYNDKQYKAARDEFFKVLQSGQPNCDAQYYLGMIYRVWQDPVDETPIVVFKDGAKVPESLANLLKETPIRSEPAVSRSANYFLGSCSCMDRAVSASKERIAAIPSLDIEAAEQVVLRGRLEKKLQQYQVTAVSIIERIQRQITNMDLQTKQRYLDMMNEILGRVRPPAVNH